MPPVVPCGALNLQRVEAAKETRALGGSQLRPASVFAPGGGRRPAVGGGAMSIDPEVAEVATAVETLYTAPDPDDKRMARAMPLWYYFTK